MKITIIGAGNMGSAMARGFLQANYSEPIEITIANPRRTKLDALKFELPALKTATDNEEAARDADIIIFAVEPETIHTAIKQTKPSAGQIIISVAANIGLTQLMEMVEADCSLFRALPNTAISINESITLISSCNSGPEQEQFIVDLFNTTGMALLLPESKLINGTILSSCGLAFAFKYLQAAMQGGIQLGLAPKESMLMVAQAMIGAGKLILETDTHPSVEIDKVTTPGGITIKGVNEMEHAGLSSAVIRAIMKSAGK